MPKETTCENICQKRPLLSGGTPGQATRGTCRLGHRRQAPAAVRITGMCPGVGAPGHISMPPLPLAAGPTPCSMPPLPLAAGPTPCSMPPLPCSMPPLPLAAGPHPTSFVFSIRTEADMPAMPSAAGPCRHRPRRHVPRVAWPGGAATQKGSFLANIFAGGLFWHFIGACGLFCQKFAPCAPCVQPALSLYPQRGKKGIE
jgi:hypothetical protein